MTIPAPRVMYTYTSVPANMPGKPNGISKDMVIYTKDEFEKSSKDITTLCYKIKKDGKVIYARA